MKKIAIIFCLIFLSGCSQDDKRFQLYKTKNIYTFLLLDTQSGRVWQTQYSLNDKDEGIFTLSKEDKSDGDGFNGRFSLVSTENIWTFLLLDKMTGGIWHCQFTVNKKSYRGCYRIAE